MLSVTFGVKIHAQTKKEGNRMEPESDSEGKCLHMYMYERTFYPKGNRIDHWE